MTKLRVVYSRKSPELSGEHNENGTSTFFIPCNSEYSGDDENHKSILFELENHRIANMFVEKWKETSHVHPSVDEYVKRFDYNEYEALDNKARLDLQTEMNDIISKINNTYKNYQVPEELYLEVSESNIQLKKLNALHEYFEDVSYKIINQKTILNQNQIDDFYVLLEKINQLVHRMEDGSQADPYLLTVIRNAVDNDSMKTIYKLNDDDYMLFEPTRPNMLYLDFATVGKDLMNCLYSDDVELVRAKKVKPQSYLMPYVRYTFRKTGLESDEYYESWERAYYKELDEWIEKNDLGSYIDHRLPKYRTGRIRLGKISNFLEYEDLLNIKNNYPYISGVYIEE